MSDVEKAIAAANQYDTSGAPHTAVTALQQRSQQQQQQHQYYIKPTITANTHYCHETGHIKTSPLTATTASPSATLPRRGHPSSAYTNTKASSAARSSSPPCSTASGASTSSSATAGSGCPSLGQHNCLSLVLKLIFSTPGLVVLVVAYSIMGAFIFPLLEAPQDLTKSAAIAKSREDCLRELWIITEKLNVLYERNWTMLVHEQLRRFEGSIVAATRHGGNGVASATARGGIAGRPDNAASATAVGRFGGQFDGLEDASRWSFSEALLYSVTVITTIGHGSLTPKTAAGKIATILYALIGVPLMLMCLSSLGSLLAEALQCTYARICCRLSAPTTTTPRATDQTTTTSKTATTKASEKKPILRKGSKRQRRYDSDGDDVRAEKKLQHAESAAVESSGGECHEKLHTTDSKGCKYDAVPHNSYNNPTLVGHNEESCHLLQHQSPIRTNQHNVGCMQQQLHQTQYYQQQQQTPQQHQTVSGQQRPDVMLMAHQPQPYNRSATSSPQHTYQPQYQQQYQVTASPPPTHHPPTTTTTPTTMQTFHLVTSAGTTAHTPTTTSPGVSQLAYTAPPPRHFVAVPSGLVRFPPNAHTNPTAVATNTVNALTLDGSGPATTTIYFPLSNSGGGAVISGSPPTQVAFMAAASSGVAATTATLAVAGSPFVKYHTIQFQPKKPYIVAANNEGDGGSMCPLVPLPPPPAYQTATVHGVRRAKFLTKPLPQEINNLLAENDIDISCRHDLAQSSCTSPITSGGVCPSGAAAPSTLASSTTTVDIMEDEEENEQDRMGCPHGTPSRIPLISSGSSSSPYGGEYTEATEKSTQRSGGGLINATAASFHRHTFQRKAASSQRRQPPKGHADNGRRRRRHTKRHSCYGDPVETTTDDDNDDMGAEYQHRRGMANEQFVLTQIDSHGRVTGTSTELDEGDDADDGDMEHMGSDLGNGGRHVPIILVLGILICYICLGTVIFAFWENWSLIDGAYFCFVTLSTIGYGDFLPERTFNGPEVQLFACCAYLLLGLVLVAMSFSILETQLLWKCKRIAVRLKLATD